MKTRIFLLFVCSLLFYLAFNSQIPITDPVESNYAQTAKEMILSGDWLSPQIYGHYWFDKPIMIYWLIAGSFHLFGVNEFAARFPSAVFSALSVSFCYCFSYKLFKNQLAALLSSLVLATSLEFWLLAHMIITDSVLFFFTSVSLALMYLSLQQQNRFFSVMSYAATALAVLTKGPVGIVLPGLILLVLVIFTKRWKDLYFLFYYPGIAVFLFICVPWYAVMYQIHGNEFLNVFLGLHNYIRATVSEHPQDNVFYYYLVLFPVSLLPWTGIFIYSLLHIPKLIKANNMLFLFIWNFFIILFYSLMATKYPTYVFPSTFPAAVILGYILEELQKKARRILWLWLTIPSFLLLVIFAIASKFLDVTTDWSLLYICLSLFFLIISWAQVKGPVNILPYLASAMVCFVSLLVLRLGLVPLAESRSANIIGLNIPQNTAKIGFYGEYSTSAIFYSGYVIPNLVEKKSKPDDDIWAGKYTIPEELISEFLEGDVTLYILVKDKYNEAFLREPFSNRFVPILYANNMTLYQRQASLK